MGKTLTPTQAAVWVILRRPGGACRLEFALEDVWEVSNRVAEVEQRLGVEVTREKCVKHNHRHPVVRYSLG